MSTRPVSPDTVPEGWERVNIFADRLPVPGGWIYEVRGAGIVFVPDPSASGVLSSVPCENLPPGLEPSHVVGCG
jgi:hypothetical protein